MPRIKGIGELEWNLENKAEGVLNLILYLDDPSVDVGEISESAEWEYWESGIVSLEANGTTTEMPVLDLHQHKLLRLPHKIRYALMNLHLDLTGQEKVAYVWRGGKKVDICINRYPKPIRRPSAFLKFLTRKMTEWAKLFPEVWPVEKQFLLIGQMPVPRCPPDVVQRAMDRIRILESDAHNGL